VLVVRFRVVFRGGVALAAPVRAPTATPPRRIFIDDEVERWIEIRDETGRLVTVIELLSPSNKGEAQNDTATSGVIASGE
jgi:hypothetical protein